MKPTTLILITAGGGLAAAAAFFASRSGDSAGDSSLESQRMARLESALRSETESRQALASSVEALVRRVDGLATHLERRPAPTAPPPEQPRVPDTSGPLPSERPPTDFLARLSDAVRYTRDGLGEDEEAFWVAARSTTMLDDSISALQARIASDPADQEARMQLADAFVAKLLTVPYGPERGIWGARAEQQWQAVLERNPRHWEAQYVLAYNYSMYPDFVAKTDEAIAGFERALEIQLGSPHRPEHARTYVDLARVHQKKGDRDRARATLEDGAARHPTNTAIAQALAALRDGVDEPPAPLY